MTNFIQKIGISILLVVTILGTGSLPFSAAAQTAAPTVSTGTASNLTATSATLNGQVNANGEPTSYWFEYGTSASLGSMTSVQAGGNGTSATNVSTTISGLSSGTTYYFRVVAQNQSGRNNGSVVSFTLGSSGGGNSGGGISSKPAGPSGGGTSIVAVSSSVNTQNPIFNNDPQDFASLRVSNYTQTPNTQTWNNQVNAQANDVISFALYYHNNSTVTANNTRMNVSFNVNPVTGTIQATSKLWADNASVVAGYATVNIQGAPQTPWQMVFDSVAWQPNQTNTSSVPLPAGQTGAEITSSNGVNIGNIEGGWSTQGSLVVRFKFVAASDSTGGIPTANTLSATDISTSAATLHGDVDPNKLATMYWFEYGTTSQLGQRTASQSITSAQTVSAIISGLSANTTYYYRVVAENNKGRASGPVLQFTTGTSGGDTTARPTVATNAATSVTTSGAQLHGQLNANGLATSYWFEYGTSQTLGLRTSVQAAGSSSQTSDVASGISGLSANTTYYYRIAAQNDKGRSYGSLMSFVTTGGGDGGNQSAPTVQTTSADTITTSSARLNGSVNSNNLATSYWFEYGTSQSLGSRTSASSLSAGSAAVNVFAGISGLSANTTYYYRIAAQNSKDRSYGSVVSFTTGNGGNGNSSPTVTTNAATNITQTAASLQGSINPNGLATNYWFEYGTTASLGTLTASQSLTASNSAQSVSAGISGLSANTMYYYRVVGENSIGRSTGSVMNFTTTSNGGGCTVNCGGNGGGGGGGSSAGGPLVNTDNASAISLTGASIYGSMFTNGYTGYAWFEYGLTKDTMDAKTNEKTINNSQNFTPFSVDLTGLQSGKTYYYRAAGRNQVGTSYGNVLSFNTFGSGVAGKLPTVTTLAPSYITQNSGLVNASVNPNSVDSTTAWFEYGTTAALGARTPAQQVGNGSTGAHISYALTGLVPNTTYFYRAVAKNAYGTVYSYILAIRTEIGGGGVVSNTVTTVTTTSFNGNGQSCILIVPAATPQDMNAGEAFTYTLTYKNGCSYALNNAFIKIIVPAETDEIKTASTRGVSEQDANGTTYALGTLQPGDQGVITVQGNVSTGVNKGDILIFSSVLNFADTKDHPQSVSSYLTAQVLSGRSLTASVFDAFRGLLGSWWFSLLLLLVIAFLIYWIFFKKQGQETIEEESDVLKA